MSVYVIKVVPVLVLPVGDCWPHVLLEGVLLRLLRHPPVLVEDGLRGGVGGPLVLVAGLPDERRLVVVGLVIVECERRVVTLELALLSAVEVVVEGTNLK